MRSDRIAAGGCGRGNGTYRLRLLSSLDLCCTIVAVRDDCDTSHVQRVPVQQVCDVPSVWVQPLFALFLLYKTPCGLRCSLPDHVLPIQSHGHCGVIPPAFVSAYPQIASYHQAVVKTQHRSLMCRKKRVVDMMVAEFTSD